MATITCNYSGSPITTSWYSSHSGAGLEVTGVTYNTDTGKLSISWRMYLREDGSHYNFIAGYASIGGTQVAWDHASEWGTYWTWDNWSNNKTFKSGTLTANWASSFALYCKAMFNYGYTDARWNNGTGCVDGSGTLYVSLPSYWNDINAWNPDQSAQHGLIFNLTTSDGGSWTDLTNEPPSSEFTKPYGTTATISNIRSNVTGAHYSGNSLASGTGDPISWTFTTANYAVQLYTAWDTYSIAYAPNGGSSTPTTQTKTYGVNLTLANAISRANGTQNGYTVTFDANTGSVSPTSKTATDTISYSFSSWKDNQGTTYSGGGTYTKNQANTLTAQWSSSIASRGSIATPTATKANETATRTVTFNATANGGTCSTPSLNSTATITYTGNGWYTATSGGTQRATNGGTYTPSASETVHQQWSSSTGSYSAVTLPAATKANSTSTRTVTFDASTNGGTCSTSTLDSTATVTYSQTGWWTASSGGTNRGNSGSTYTPSAAETVYAQFSSTTGTYSAVTLPAATKANSTSTRTVTFNANQGTTTKASQNSTATVTYSQTGWWTAASGGTNRGNSGATYTPSASEKIYAQFSSSTGSYSAVTLPTAVECTRSGYILLGWATTDTAATAAYLPGASYTPSANITLYAVWELDQATVWYKTRLPREYQEVEYIESSDQDSSRRTYIDLPSMDYNNSEVFCELMQAESITDNNYFGYLDGNGKNRLESGVGWTNSSLSANFGMEAWRVNGNILTTDEWHTIEIKPSGFYVDGAQRTAGEKYVDYGDWGYFNTSISVMLFGTNRTSFRRYYPNLKMKKFQVKKNGAKVLELVPCYRKSDNVIGLYDVINNVFYTNDGNGTFVKGNDIDGYWTKGKVWVKKELPNTYQEVEYIESTGTQYIDTNIPINFGYNFVFDIEPGDERSGWITLLGATSDPSNKFRFCIRTASDNNALIGYINGVQTLEYCSGLANNRNLFEANLISGNSTLTFGNYVVSTTETSFGNNVAGNFTLFMDIISSGDKRDPFVGKIYEIKIYSNTTLIGDYVPCYRKSDNVVGMYDIIAGAFYINAGSGVFGKGVDINNSHWTKAKKFYTKQNGSWVENKTTA